MKVLASSAAASSLPLYGAEQRRLAFTQWDVFTKKPLTGNPLAVFGDARGLSDAEMQALARETNLSETTFIFPRDASVGVARPDEQVIVEQGLEVQLPGQLFMRASRSGDRVANVRVGGFAVKVMQGEYVA